MPLSTTATTGNTSADKKNLVPYSIGTLDGDFGESVDPTTSTYTALCTVSWASADEWLEDMVGRTDEAIGGGLRRILPEYCPHKPRAYAVKADLLRFTGFTGNDAEGWPEFDQATYRVTYAVPLYDVKEDEDVTYEHQRFCVWNKRITAQNEKIPGLTYKFVNATKTPLNEVGVRMGRQLEMTCKWLDVPDFDYSVISTYANKVNDAAITLDGTEWAAETVLFVGGSEDPKVNGAGQRNRDITLTFLCRIDGRTWNKFWDKTAAGADKYVLVTDDGETGGDKIFRTADLNLIWTLS